MADNPSSTHQKFAMDVIIIGVATGLVALSGIFMMPLLTRTLGDTGYGIWAQSLATSGLMLMVVSLNLPYPMLRFLPAEKVKAIIRDDVYSVLCLSLLLALVVSVIMVIFAGPIARTFFGGVTQIVRLTAVIIVLTSPFSVYSTFIRVFDRTKIYALFALIDAYGQLGLVAFLVLHGHGLESVFVGLVALKALLLICWSAYVTSQIGAARPRFLRIRQYLLLALPTFPAVLSWWVVSSSDRYVIATYLGLASVGIYSAAYGVGNIIILIVTILGFVLTPTLSRLYDEGKMKELSTQISYSLKYFLMLAIPFVVGAAVLARPLLTLFSTAEIASRGHVVLPLIALSILVYGAYVIVGQVLFVTKRTTLLASVWVAAAAVNLGFNILLVPRIGVNGSAISSLIAYALVLGIASYRALQDVRFPIDWRFIIKTLVASGLMAALIAFVHPQTRLETVGTVAAGVVAYAMGLLLLRAIRKDEIMFFTDLVQRRSAQGPGA